MLLALLKTFLRDKTSEKIIAVFQNVIALVDLFNQNKIQLEISKKMLAP